MPKTHDRIGPYELLRKLGQGAFGEVWLARNVTALAARDIALKIPLDDNVNLAAIRQEAAIWIAASGHVNVLPIIEANLYDGQVVIASEYAPDGSLQGWLNRHGGRAPSLEAALEMTRGILAGLEYLHTRKIIHRDLKPDNVLLQGATPRIADFGISRVLKSTVHSAVMAGTMAYMAPEAFKHKRNEQTDLWAVSVILYQMLAGQLPFRGQDPAEVIGAILHEEPEPLPTSVPVWLQEVVAKTLRKDAAERYHTAAALHAALTPAPVPERSTPLSGAATLPLPKTPRLPSTVRVSPLAPAPIEPAPAPQQPVVAPYDTGAAKTELPVIGKQGRAHKSLLAAVIGLAAIAGAGYLATRGAPGSTISESRDTDNQPTLNSAAPFTENLNGVRLEMAPVPSGSFLMGSPESEKGRYGDEGPQHRVTVSGFYIGRYEVTQAQWQAVMGANPANFKGDDDLPVERVSWSGAKEFCVKLSRITGKTYRLPSEAEWEYACRAGTTDPYAGDLDALAWYSNNSGNKTHPVGQKQANAFGLFDMHGNVWEWCEDISHGGYGRQHGNPPMDGSAWLSDGNPSARVLRGGSFNYNDKSCRSASRNGASDDRYVNAGFRVVVSARTQ